MTRTEETLATEVNGGEGSSTLPRWVRVRAYADLKVGERVFTIGAPRGL
jgi:hypothetical protein